MGKRSKDQQKILIRRKAHSFKRTKRGGMKEAESKTSVKLCENHQHNKQLFHILCSLDRKVRNKNLPNSIKQQGLDTVGTFFPYCSSNSECKSSRKAKANFLGKLASVKTKQHTPSSIMQLERDKKEKSCLYSNNFLTI